MEQKMVGLHSLCQADIQKAHEKDQQMALSELSLVTTLEAPQTPNAELKDQTLHYCSATLEAPQTPNAELKDQTLHYCIASNCSSMAQIQAAEVQAKRAVESEARAQQLLQEKIHRIQQLELANMSLGQEVARVADKDREIRELSARLCRMEA